MNLKKFAVRGIIVLAVFVALCLFFSGTVRTITTPKIKQTAARRGKLEERIPITAKLYFPDVVEIGIKLPADTTVTIARINTRVGYKCSKGEVLAEAKVTNYDQLRKQYQDAYDQASEQLMTLESKNKGIRISKRDEAFADAYYALRDAKRKAAISHAELRTLLVREKLTMPDTGYPEGASEALIAAIDAYNDALAKRETAQSTWDMASRYTVDEAVWSYITEKHSCEEKLSDAESGLEKLMELESQVSELTAPHDGYVAQINFKEGDTCDGTQPILSITEEEKMPLLRADISELDRTVKEGMTVSFKADSYNSVETKVTSVGVDMEGKEYADIELSRELISKRGSIYAMTQEETPLTLVYRDKEATTLLPVNAVRGSGDSRYVYVVEKEEAAFGNIVLKIRKVDVTVLTESDGMVSIEDDLSYYSIAYMEDRPISEGDRVMEYSEQQSEGR